jgi:3-oxoacyl-[acyl-carrier protein] reductase
MVDLNNELAGKVAIVTGSARNIGRATVRELARAGAAVVVNARTSRDLCDQLADEIVADGGRALAVLADITDGDAVEAMVAATVAEFGGIDILVNNAATRSSKSIEELDIETWDFALDTALNGAFRVTRACVPHIIARGGGSIIGLGGLNSHRGAPARSHVMASKGGLAGFVRGLALDLGKHNIRANMVMVGTFDTDRAGSNSIAPPAADIAGIPLGRRGVPQDMADLIRFLVGPGAGYISGQTIHCNGAAHCPS